MKRNRVIICMLVLALGAAPALWAESAATALETSAAPTAKTAPPVTCRNGTFTGIVEPNGVYAYLGIPFAKPPVGGLRWKAPVDVEDCQGQFKADHFGPQPLQIILASDEAPNDTPCSEDCLCLNVWTADPNIQGKPVMVYFHGGAYGWESTSDALYNLRNIARENPDIVFVSAEYRVNAMGFIDLSRVPDGQKYKAADFKGSTQLGILDNVAALRWVNRNIAAFGGDKDKVTVFGESAGGGISSILMIAKEAKGLFRRAIPMSGAANLSILKADYEHMDQAGALMEATGCKNLDDLMALTDKQILEAFEKDTDRVGLEGTSGVQHLNGHPMRGEGGIIPENPMKAMEEGAGGDIDMLVGSTADEWRYWVYEMEQPTLEENFAAYYEFMKVLARRFVRFGEPCDISTCLDAVQDEQDGQDEWSAKFPGIWRYTAINNEKTFRASAINQAEAHVKSGGTGRTYMYYFAKRSSKEPWVGACHSVELPYVLLNADAPTVTGKPDMELARKVSRIWTNFARFGNPSIEGVPCPEYDLINRATLVIGDDNSIQVVNDPQSRLRRAVQELIRKYAK